MDEMTIEHWKNRALRAEADTEYWMKKFEIERQRLEEINEDLERAERELERLKKLS